MQRTFYDTYSMSISGLKKSKLRAAVSAKKSMHASTKYDSLWSTNHKKQGKPKQVGQSLKRSPAAKKPRNTHKKAQNGANFKFIQSYIQSSIKFKKPNPKQPRSHALAQCNKENQPNNSLVPSSKQFPQNKDLLRSSTKPSRLNFLNKISTIYELVISQAVMPSFITYFLGEALYLIRPSQSRYTNPVCMSGHSNSYDWKLEEFKQACEKIYENSQEQDLRFFMSLELPAIARWGTRLSQSKNTIDFMPGIYNGNESRQSSTMSKNGQESRVNYFSALQKRDRAVLVGGGKGEEGDLLDKLNQKLDRYLKGAHERMGKSGFI